MSDFFENEINEFKSVTEMAVFAYPPFGKSDLEYFQSLSLKLNEMRSFLCDERDDILKTVDKEKREQLKEKLNELIREKQAVFMEKYQLFNR